MKKTFKEKIFKFTVPKVDDATIMSHAMTDFERFNRAKEEKAEDIPYTRMKHITVNYIRHRAVKNYNQHCRVPSFQKEPELYLEWFTAINKEIARVYPYLKAECEFQIQAKIKKASYAHPYG